MLRNRFNLLGWCVALCLLLPTLTFAQRGGATLGGDGGEEEKVVCGEMPAADITVTNISSSSVSVSWPENGAADYMLRVRKSGTSGWSVWVTQSSPYTLNFLASCTTYDLQFITFCKSGYRDWHISDIIQFTTECCDPIGPADITFTNIGLNEVTVNWTDNGAHLWVVQWQDQNGNWNGGVPPHVTSNSYTITGLNSCETYNVRITSECGDESDPTTVNGTVAPFDTDCCDAIDGGDMTFSDITANSVTVSWPDNGADAWVVQWQDQNGNWNAGPPPSTTTNSFTITGLNPCEPYNIRLTTYCPDGMGGYNILVGTVGTVTTLCCDATDGVDMTFSDITANSVTVSWPDNGADAWVVQWQDQNGNWNAGPPPSTTTNSFTITGLNPCEPYNIRLTTYCPDGMGGYNILVGTVGTVTTLCCDATDGADMTFSDITGTSVTVSWPDNGADAWVVQWQDQNGNWNAGPPPSTTTNSFTITGLNPCEPYNIRLTTYCPDGMGGYNILVGTVGTVTTLCCDATDGEDMTFSNITGNSVTVSWPDNSADAWVVQWQDQNGNWNAGPPPSTTTNSYTITGLNDCETYNVRLTTYCPDGMGGYNILVGTVGTFTTVCCAALQDVELSFTNITMTSVTVNWTDNGAVAWTIQWQDAFGNWNTGPPPSSLTNSYTITGLNPCAEYAVRVNSYCPGNNFPFIGDRARVMTACMKTFGAAGIEAAEMTVYPNPFSAATTIRIETPEAGMASVEIYDLSGRMVAQPLSAQQVEAGMLEVNFNGSELRAGMYICKLTLNDQVIHERISVIR